MVRGHEYLHYKGLRCDLVILNDTPTQLPGTAAQRSCENVVRTGGLQGLCRTNPAASTCGAPGSDCRPDRILLHAVARVVIVTDRGSFENQMERSASETVAPDLMPRQASQTYPEPTIAPPELTFFNGLGGFQQGGREYVTLLGAEQWTPAPWSNVIGNAVDFGFQITETGGGFTWAVNSRENRLTPWSNDAVSDPPGEVVYLRDEESGTVWSPTPLPIREREPYIISHGQGYSVFEHTSHGMSQELLVFAPLDAPVKISLLRLHNRTAASGV